MPEVCWLMPVYNAAATLSGALESIRAQSHRDWKLIAVDDGSEDSSLAILEKAAAQDKRIEVLSRPHEGLPRALNAGLERADADWVARMDADDTCAPERLERQLEYAAEHPECEVIASCAEHRSGGLRDEGILRYVDWTNGLLTHAQMACERFVEQPLVNPTTLVRRQAFERYGAYGLGDYPEDYELWLRWMEQGACFGKCPDTLYYWQDRAERYTRVSDFTRTEAFYRLKAHYLARWLAVQKARPVWVWGAGRVTRRRAAFLREEGVKIEAWIDIDRAKVGRVLDGVRVHAPEEVPQAGAVCVLGYVASWGAREAIRLALGEQGCREGVDFMMVA